MAGPEATLESFGHDGREWTRKWPKKHIVHQINAADWTNRNQRPTFRFEVDAR